MNGETFTKARSFVLDLFNAKQEKCLQYSLPIAVAAPFANRLIDELLVGDEYKATREPWYFITPRYRNNYASPFRRSLLPIGPTSLYGKRYYPDLDPVPPVSNYPFSEVSHFTVHLVEFNKILYEGEYYVDDIFWAIAKSLTKMSLEKGQLAMEEGPFFYQVDTSRVAVRSVSPDLFPSEAYQCEGIFQLPPREQERERTLFYKVPTPPLPVQSSENYGGIRVHGMGKPMEGRVIMHTDVYQFLCKTLPLSDTVEEGGYLLGTPYRKIGSPEDENAPDFCWSLEITDVIKAENTWGKPGLLLFTGDSWSQVARRRAREFPDKRIVSWFHTHLFDASESFGLSELDQDLHRRFFTKRWQVAILLNLNTDGERVIRCFQRGPEGDLVESNFEVYRSQRPVFR